MLSSSVIFQFQIVGDIRATMGTITSRPNFPTKRRLVASRVQRFCPQAGQILLHDTTTKIFGTLDFIWLNSKPLTKGHTKMIHRHASRAVHRCRMGPNLWKVWGYHIVCFALFSRTLKKIVRICSIPWLTIELIQHEIKLQKWRKQPYKGWKT